MGAAAPAVSMPARPLDWFRDFLKEELSPYPGRAALVARMTIAATLVMVISMTFRIPDAAYGAVYAITISRESPRATVADTKIVAIALAIAAGYELIGAMFFLNEPVFRLLWVLVTFFVVFYALSAMTNYAAAARFGYLVIITTPLWDRYISAEAKVEGTLWAVGTITVATVITAAVELVYAELNRGSDLLVPIAERLACVEQLLISYAENRPLDETTKKQITRLVSVGISRLRRHLQRSSYSANYREQMGAVLALVARLVDVAANLADLDIQVFESDGQRMRSLAERIAGIRIDLEHGRVPHQADFDRYSGSVSSVPLLSEMEATVSLIPGVFIGSHSLSAYAPPAVGDAPRVRLFRPDALSNFDHLKFGLKGCLAASLCYIIYNLLDWQGLSTAVATCFLTALTTIGSSRQKQILRIAGAFVGGVVLGFGSQIFILPSFGSISEFAVLFIAATILAAWFATASARFSYFGVQVAVGFYLINLQEFKIQTSLAVARDRFVGTLLGLFMMWLVFDQLWGAPAAVEMKRTFILNLRLLAQFAGEPVSKNLKVETERAWTLRETINNNLDNVRALADGVLLEFGPTRLQDLALRSRIRQWQTQLRIIFVTRIALWKYRMRLPGFELPEAVVSAQQEFDDTLARTLKAIADRFDGKPAGRDSGIEDSLERLERTVKSFSLESQGTLPSKFATFLALSRRIADLARSLNAEI